MSKGRYYPKGAKPQKQGSAEILRKLGEEIEKARESLSEMTVEHSAGGGAVVAVVDGTQKIRSIRISPEAIDPDDTGLLEDMIIAAVNGAIEESKETAEETMSKLTGGLGLPGVPGS
ncbi:MAG: YbaB/EbfC family nucleoid-associated protein [Actinomycetota bacterium]|nr:YbaB/EbfC family nucleoid-associated protein [Actinomycetota bacterium]